MTKEITKIKDKINKDRNKLIETRKQLAESYTLNKVTVSFSMSKAEKEYMEKIAAKFDMNKSQLLNNLLFNKTFVEQIYLNSL